MNLDMPTVLLIINTASAFFVVIRGLFYALNRMNKETWFIVRASWILVTTGAMAVMLAPLFTGHIPSWPEVLFTAGMALFFAAERRCYYRCRMLTSSFGKPDGVEMIDSLLQRKPK